LDWKRAFEVESSQSVDDVYAIKYYKGLATLESVDVKRVFANLAKRLVCLSMDETTLGTMQRYFGKESEDERKQVLCELANRLNEGATSPEPESVASSIVSVGRVGKHAFSTYVYWDVGAFFLSDVIRSVFMYVDGLKPS
jgi:hypothetical protein